MPVETLQQPVKRSVRTAIAATPPRLRPKGQVAPEVYRQCLAAAGRPKQSAVERLEADKAKYVKSQVALSKQLPVRPPEVTRPFLSPRSALQPTRKTPVQTKTKQESVQLNLEHLSNLISGVNDGPQSSLEDSQAEFIAQQKREKPCPLPLHEEEEEERRWWSAKVRLKASGPSREESVTTSPVAGTVRRVDVMPQTTSMRTPVRPAQFMRQPLHPLPLHSQFSLHPPNSHLRLFHPRTTPTPSPLKPVVAPPKPENPPAPSPIKPSPAPPHLDLLVLPPPSPAITRLSSSSSRKRPSLTRSKSDLSDRYSRAGTELERFFNLCGLDPADLQELNASSSDIVSHARFRSVSAPGSECAGSGREDEEGEGTGNAAERVPYGVSVIERNARVIKWLYGLRQDKDSTNKSSNL